MHDLIHQNLNYWDVKKNIFSTQIFFHYHSNARVSGKAENLFSWKTKNGKLIPQQQTKTQIFWKLQKMGVFSFPALRTLIPYVKPNNMKEHFWYFCTTVTIFNNGTFYQLKKMYLIWATSWFDHSSLLWGGKDNASSWISNKHMLTFLNSHHWKSILNKLLT